MTVAIPSVASVPNERWATDLCRVWTGRDGWATLALMIDCHTRELLGWHLSRSGKATTAGSALEQALIARFGTLGRVPTPFCCGRTMGESSAVGSTPRSCAAMAYSKSLSRPIHPNRMG